MHRRTILEHRHWCQVCGWVGGCHHLTTASTGPSQMILDTITAGDTTLQVVFSCEDDDSQSEDLRLARRNRRKRSRPSQDPARPWEKCSKLRRSRPWPT